MFDIGWPELLVIAIVLVVVVGPKDLPRMLRTFGRTTSKMRSMANDFRKQFDDALKEAELDDVRKIVDDARSLNPKKAIRRELASLDSIGREVESDLRNAARPNSEAAKTGEAAPAEASPAEPLKGPVAGDAPANAAEKADAPARTSEKADASAPSSPVNSDAAGQGGRS